GVHAQDDRDHGDLVASASVGPRTTHRRAAGHGGARPRRGRHDSRADEAPARPAPGGAVATPAGVVAQLRTLPPRQRAAIVLRYYEDLSEAQTAEVMGCSVGTVKAQVSTGLGRLRDRSGANLDTSPLDNEAVNS